MIGSFPFMIGDFPIMIGSFPFMIGDFPIMIGGLPFMIGDFPIMIGGLPFMIGDFPIMIGGFPVMIGDLPIMIGGFPFMIGESPIMEKKRGWECFVWKPVSMVPRPLMAVSFRRPSTRPQVAVAPSWLLPHRAYSCRIPVTRPRSPWHRRLAASRRSRERGITLWRRVHRPWADHRRVACATIEDAQHGRPQAGHISHHNPSSPRSGSPSTRPRRWPARASGGTR